MYNNLQKAFNSCHLSNAEYVPATRKYIPQTKLTVRHNISGIHCPQTLQLNPYVEKNLDG